MRAAREASSSRVSSGTSLIVIEVGTHAFMHVMMRICKTEWAHMRSVVTNDVETITVGDYVQDVAVGEGGVWVTLRSFVE